MSEVLPESTTDYGWPLDWTPDETADPAQVALASQYAANTMRMLTANRVGGRPVTVMPCGAACGRPVRAGTFEPYVGVDGGYFNRVCGCDMGCSCSGVSSVYLDGPVGRIDEVRVGGEVLAPNLYRVENGYRLVRTDGKAWPSCSSDDFTVTYLQGYPVDAMGSYVGGLLAKEFLKSLIDPKNCRLPANVTGLTRQGVSMEITSGMFPGGRTGIREVDAYLQMWNPYALKTAPTVHSPDVRRNRAITWRA